MKRFLASLALECLLLSTARAQQFVDVFSSLFRYVLEVIEQPLVPVRGEVEFARAVRC